MFRRRLSIELFGTQTWVATAEDVLLRKLYWNKLTPSERQLLDAAGVFAVQAEDLELHYLKLWAPKLGVSVELDDLISGRLRPKST